MSKSSAIAALQASGEGSYDQVREVLKGVSVDASGKVELEDWVEVCLSAFTFLCWVLMVWGWVVGNQATCGAGEHDLAY